MKIYFLSDSSIFFSTAIVHSAEKKIHGIPRVEVFYSRPAFTDRRMWRWDAEEFSSEEIVDQSPKRP